ncbi:hypothetical protein CHU92_01570 [Flavobacterium cyanobacteriorum]|uniref:Uncharacterized protein n=1 Tax=Flavobacterium cyanobacteriorum TaxID=2022802 RepID=A0A255ZXM6_9FLAO|nr:antitoxin Xre/MbcA/ParS toxin-binding domain-containing protein [Flavobacterium cyanobacteriorum]OYQ46151.1 hypothetical protein CHU92_01570 [Flavobacterium cyanobacteriorum]
MDAFDLFNPETTYNATDDKNILSLIELVRNGIAFSSFVKLVESSAFDLNEWSSFLHLSERTMQRYKKEGRTFDVPQSEKILEITLLYRKGVEVFGSDTKFNAWLDTENLALGRIRPKELLDNSFGIGLIRDELTRIEHGVLS